MAYGLDEFCKDAHDSLIAEPGTAGRQRVREHLERLLANGEFVAATLGDDAPPKRVLYDDPELGFQVLAHVHEPGTANTPHDHGPSWAVYGQAVTYTQMTEWRRTDDGDDAGRAALEQTNSFRLEAGKAALFDEGAIHSLARPDGSRVIRVTGGNLETVLRHRFDPEAATVTAMPPTA